MKFFLGYLREFKFYKEKFFVEKKFYWISRDSRVDNVFSV